MLSYLTREPLCICVSVCVSMHACMCLGVRAYACVYLRVYACECVCMCACVHLRMYACVCVCMCACVYVCVFVNKEHTHKKDDSCVQHVLEQ